MILSFQRTTLSAILFLILLFLAGCSGLEQRTYEITFIVGQLDKNPSNSIPADLWPIFYPLTNEDCNSFSYRANNLTFFRGDLINEDSVIFEINSSQGQKIFGVADLEEIDVDLILEEDIKIGKILSKKPGNSLDRKKINEIISVFDEELILEVNVNKDSKSNLENNTGIKFFKSIDDLLLNLTETLCIKNEKSSKVLVLYNLIDEDSGLDTVQKPDIYESNISKEINLVANRKDITENRQLKVIEVMNNFFEEGAKVIEISPEGMIINGQKDEGFPLVKDWLKALSFSRTIEKVSINEVKRDPNSGKIRELTIIEFHRGNEINE